jgi:hypothetical protein
MKCEAFDCSQALLERKTPARDGDLVSTSAIVARAQPLAENIHGLDVSLRLLRFDFELGEAAGAVVEPSVTYGRTFEVLCSKVFPLYTGTNSCI